VLKGNLLGDPNHGIVDVYVPPGHDGRGLPLLVDLVGFTAGGPAHTNWKNFGENLPERLDRLIAGGKMPPVPLVEARFGCGGTGRPGVFGKSSGGYGAMVPERWANWLAWDPLTLVDQHGPGLKALKALYIDCGDVDQYNLVYGARRMHKRLAALGVQHVYEEFADDHTAVDYRMDVSLPILAKALS
jgi:hypothetical protein